MWGYGLKFGEAVAKTSEQLAGLVKEQSNVYALADHGKRLDAGHVEVSHDGGDAGSRA